MTPPPGDAAALSSPSPPEGSGVRDQGSGAGVQRSGAGDQGSGSEGAAPSPPVPSPAPAFVPPAVPPLPGAELRIHGEPWRFLGMLKSDFFSDNYLLERAGAKAVLKRARFRHIGGRLLEPLAGLISRRESRTYRILDGIPGIPRFLGEVGPDAHLHEFIEGENLSQHERRCGKHALPPGFFDELGRILDQVHARGVAYADLCKKGNVLVGTDGRAWLIDFTISFSVDHGPRLFAGLRRWFYALICEVDRYHLLKFKRKFQRERLTPAEWAVLERRPLTHRIYRILGQRPYQAVKRLIYPKGSNEVFRFSKDLKRLGD